MEHGNNQKSYMVGCQCWSACAGMYICRGIKAGTCKQRERTEGVLQYITEYRITEGRSNSLPFIMQKIVG